MSYITSDKLLAICRRKIDYDSPQAAYRAAASYQKQFGIGMRVYKCDGAKGQQRHWHVTRRVK